MADTVPSADMTSDMVRTAAFTLAICHLDQGPRIEAKIADKLEALAHFPSASFLLIDNGSRDGSHAVFDRLAQEDPRFKWVLEPQRGLYYSRRRAILAAQGDFLITVDDDVQLSPESIIELLSPLVTNPQIGVVGARVDLVWEAPRPDWLPAKVLNQFATDIKPKTDERYTKAYFPCFPTGVAQAIRLGPCADLYCQSPRSENYPLGRRRADPQAGINGQDVGGEDIDLCEIFARNGFQVLFSNHAPVLLDVPAERIDPDWFTQRFRADGRTRIRVLRCTGRSVFSAAGYKFILGLPILTALAIFWPFMDRRKRLLWRCYWYKAFGAWEEWLGEAQSTPWPYQAPGGPPTP